MIVWGALVALVSAFCFALGAVGQHQVAAQSTSKTSFNVKLFLDLVPRRGLEGTVAVPVMLCASPAHGMAVETALRPVLVELGATVPASLSLVDATYDDPATYAEWGERTRPLVLSLVTALDTEVKV